MKTFTHCIEKKANQLLNLLQGYTKGIRMAAILVLLLMGVSNAWADDGDFYNTYLTYTFGTTNGSAEDKDNGTGLSKDLETLKSGSFKITAVYLKCWDDWGYNYKSSGGQMCYSKDGGDTQYLTGFSRSNKTSNSDEYQWQNTNANLTIANSTDKSGSYTLTCWFQTWGWGDRFFPKSSGNYTFTYKIAPPSVKGFTVTPSGNKLSGSGTQNEPYIIKYNGSLTLTLSGSPNHIDANSTIQYNTSGTWNTTPSRTISNITSTDVKNVTVKARYKNNSDANLCGAESSQTIHYRSEQVYTVTFNANGHGTAPAAQTVSQGSTATQPTAPTATGYTFGGWYKESNCTNAFDFNTAINADITLYAKWTANTYTVTLNLQGGTGGTTSVTATYGSAMPNITVPTRTGYTFGGYFTQTGGQGTQYYSGNGSSARTWNRASNTTLYANWIETKYTITITNNGSGTVSPYSVSVGRYTASNDITANPADGYRFVNWTATEGITITNATNSTTTIKATQAGTLTANFEKLPDNVVYLKPSHIWKQHNARFAVCCDDTHWIEMEDVGCTGEYYKVSIPSEYSKFKFVRSDPNAELASSTWNATGDITIPTDGKNLYDMTKIYLKPNANWKRDGARFAAYIFNNENNHWMSMLATDEGGVYYCDFPTEHMFSTVSFVRMNGANSTNNWDNRWNQTKDIDLYQGYNRYELEENKWGKNASGNEDDEMDVVYTCQWTTFNPTYDVILEPTPYGYYTVDYNGRTYKSGEKDTVVIYDVPLGASIYVSEGVPYSDAYNSDMLLQRSPGGEIVEKAQDKTYTICGTTYIDENFVTNDDHIVYLRIPNDMLDSWNNTAAGGANTCVYSFHNMNQSSTGDIGVMEQITNHTYESGYTYYKYTIPAGCHTFRFERKGEDFDAVEQPKSQSKDFVHLMPFGEINCYTITNNIGGNLYDGYWCVLLEKGDYRLLYVEQVVEKDDWKTVVKRTKAHPSDIIKANDTRTKYSLHIYNEMREDSDIKGWNNPEIILQQWDGSQWVDKEAHMVFGPLRSTADMAMMPGRRNASPGSDVDSLVYDDGIENIKNDLKNIKEYQADNNKTFYIGDVDNYDEYAENFANDSCSGVWNFVVNRDGEGNITLDLTQTHRYNGDYYIRTDAADGGWANYTTPTSHMTRSNVSKQNSNFSHYFCRWIESNNNVNVKYTIANNYGYAISDTLAADETTLWGNALTDGQKMVTDTENLPDSASVRFAWNEKTNFLHRAYLSGSTNVSDRFLVLTGRGDGELFDAEGNELTAGGSGSDRYGLNDNEEIFTDISNWVYFADVQMKPNAGVKLTAKYNNQIQYFIGKEEEYSNTILQGTDDANNNYLIRLLYDFKTNELVSAYVPGGNTDIEAIQTNLMLIRQGNGPASQLEFTTNDMNNVDKRAYGVLELPKDTLEDDTKNVYARSLYWISFPFDVRITDIFGFGEYGKHWLIQSYDGAKRAREGLWADSETNWVYHFDPQSLNADTEDAGIMKRGVGYVVALNLNNIKADKLFVGRINTLALYFPSTSYIAENIVNKDNVSITVPEHECTIKRPTPDGDRTIKDSHWNVIGVPSYVNAGANFNSAVISLANELKFYYRWDGAHDAYTPMEADSHSENTYTSNFQSMHAYMVQYAGNLTWSNVVNEGPASLAARKDANSAIERKLRLELQHDGNSLDRTFITLQEDDVTAGFDFNYDLTKIINAGSNIYSIITTGDLKTNAAGNVLPLEDNTIIPLGVVAGEAGEYTFAMPDGTDGIVVELIDYETNTTTNLLFGDYTVALPKGTFENRFALFARPEKTATSVEDIVGEAAKGVKKYIIDGKLYLQQGELMYDAQGKRL